VVQDHYRAMVDGKPPKAALELIPIVDRAHAIRRCRLVSRQQSEVRRPLAGPTSLGIAGAYEEPVRPGVKARRIAKLGKVPPDSQQRLLRGVLGELGVAQDPVRHRMESVAACDGEAREGLLVAVLRPDHEIGVHAIPLAEPRWIRCSHSVRAGQAGERRKLRYRLIVMADLDLFKTINELSAEEEQLYASASDGSGLTQDQQDRLDAIKVQLDRCYDLLHQRQARAAAGLNPDEAEARSAETVEGYEQ
jgi:Protein of unknown function (DUF2630)